MNFYLFLVRIFTTLAKSKDHRDDNESFLKSLKCLVLMVGIWTGRKEVTCNSGMKQKQEQ